MFDDFNWDNPDYVEVFRLRQERLNAIRADPTHQLLAAHIKHYETNPVDFIQDWMCTYDPRTKNPTIPFILFPKQKDFINWIVDRHLAQEDGLVEKSRDMGLTWLCMAISIWFIIFQSGTKIGFGSRKQDLVDKIGDMDSIFEKGRFIIEWLPIEFLPLKGIEAPFLKIINKDTGAAITGEAGDQIGRGGRNSMYFKDESAFYERPMKIDAALSQNSNCKFDISTPNGIGNPFYEKRHGGVIDVFTFHWKDDPRKDEEWYLRQKAILDPVIVAQEIDIDYGASVEGIVIPAKWVRAAVELNLPKEGARRMGLDVADEGGDANAVTIVHGVVVEYVESWKEGNTAQTTNRAYDTALANNVDYVNYDGHGVGSGVKGEYSNIKSRTGTKAIPFNAVDSGIKGISKGDFFPGKKCSDMFVSGKAEMWWRMRKRFENTYNHVNNIREHPIDDLISIPNNGQLIAELSQATRHRMDSGKMKVDKKGKGSKSPNLADSLIYAFHRPPTINIRIL